VLKRHSHSVGFPLLEDEVGTRSCRINATTRAVYSLDVVLKFIRRLGAGRFSLSVRNLGYALGFTGLTRPTERVFCGVISQISNAVPSLLRYYWYSLSMTVDCRNPGESWTDVDGSRHSISWPAYRVDTQQYLAIGQTNFTHTIFHQLVVVFSCSHN